MKQWLKFDFPLFRRPNVTIVLRNQFALAISKCVIWLFGGEYSLEIPKTSFNIGMNLMDVNVCVCAVVERPVEADCIQYVDCLNMIE